MDNTNINQQDVIFALDIGTRSIIGTAGVVKDKKFYVVAESCVEHESRAMIDGQIHDIGLVANVVNKVKKELEEKLKTKLDSVSIAAAGRFLRTEVAKVEMPVDYDREIDKDTIRSLELTVVKCAEEKINEKTEGKLYCVGYSVKNYYLNGYIINNLLSHKGENISAEVIATFLPRSVVDSLYSVMEKVELKVVSLTLEPIAAMEAAIPQNLRLLNLALVDIGAGTSDIAISSKDTISAYGMVPLAGDEVTEAIAQNYLVDFNTAEEIKKQCGELDKIVYTDVLGLENEVNSEEVVKFITPVVKKISEEIGRTLISLNGDKAPNAVFLVGGGAHTPKLKDFLAEELNLQAQRIAVKGREAVTDCVCEDNSLGSIGVTVLGIALVSIKRLGHDFIDVILNGSVISLFNSHEHTVMDVMMQAGINPKVLVGRNGKNIKFNFNGIKRVAFGSLASSAEIRINKNLASIDESVKEGDSIEINYAIEGRDAEPKVKDYVNRVYSIGFFINDLIENLEPVGILNDEKVDLNCDIKEGDNFKIVYAETLGDYKNYYTENPEDYVYYLDGEELKDDYRIKEGDRIYRIKIEDKIKLEENVENIEELNEKKDIVVEENIDVNQSSAELEVAADKEEKKLEATIEEKIEELDGIEIQVVANGKPVILKGKNEYIFVDIFNHIEFDLTIPKGEIYLHINGQNAGYYDKLKHGDVVEIGWK